MQPSPINIPTLNTNRLLLEPLAMKHSQGMFELWRHFEVQKYSGIAVDQNGLKINMPAKATDDSDRLIGFWLKAAQDGWGFRWGILLEENVFVGHIGFNSLAECAEIAYHLNPNYWGDGIMLEAAHAAINWQRGCGATEIEAFIEPENAASIALAKRLGMHATKEFSEGAQRYLMSL